MTLIPLTQGQVALIDDEDADLSNLRWHAHKSTSTFYADRYTRRPNGKKTTESLHHTVWARAHPGELIPQLDHRDGNGLNCRRANLRAATSSENNRNRRVAARNTSGFKGVTWHKQLRRWQAQIKLDGSCQYLGVFHNPIDAARAFDDAARKLHGEFACLNFPRLGEQAARRELAA